MYVSKRGAMYARHTAAGSWVAFVNFYTWGDFKGNPSAWMERYFHAFLYLANWGTHELMLRLPRGRLAPETAQLYCRGDSAQARMAGDFTILEFHSEDEAEDVYDGSGWLSSLISLRADLASGDHRALYFGWLLGVQNEGVDETDREPPVPAGLCRTPRVRRLPANRPGLDRRGGGTEPGPGGGRIPGGDGAVDRGAPCGPEGPDVGAARDGGRDSRARRAFAQLPEVWRRSASRSGAANGRGVARRSGGARRESPSQRNGEGGARAGAPGAGRDPGTGAPTR